MCVHRRGGAGLVEISTLSVLNAQTWASRMAKVWLHMCMLRKLQWKIPLLQN